MSTLYTIRDWDQHFEKAQSKSVRSTSWVPLPNKHDGKSYRRLMRMPRGMEIYAAWVLIVQVASKCRTRGVLSDADGPLTADDIADKTGASADVVQLALDACSDAAIGWICRSEIADSTLQAGYERAGATGQDKTGDGRTEQDKTPPNPLKGGDGSVASPDECADEVLKAWNSCGVFRSVRLPVSAARRRILMTRVRDLRWRESWEEALARALASPFCIGENERGWVAHIDWFLRPETVTKILEGQYDGNANGKRNSSDGRDLLQGLKNFSERMYDDAE